MALMTHHTIYKSDQYYCGPGPSVVCDENGTLTVVFRRVRSWLNNGHAGHWHPSTETCITHSTDNGQTWSPPRTFLAGYQCPDLTRLRDGTLILSTHRLELVPNEIRATCPDTRGVQTSPWPGIHAGTYIWRSEDNGQTWLNPVNLHGVPNIEPLHPNLPIPLAVRGNVLETSDKGLLISAYDLPTPNTAHLFQSKDGGYTWAYVSPIAKGFNETTLIETESGTLLAFLRGWESDHLHRAYSTNGGQTWSKPEPICKGYPASAVHLPSKRIFLTYGYRFKGAYGIRASILSPNGNLVANTETIIRDDGAVSDLGYPKSCCLLDGH
ncbi:MAG: sialidase family protein, partial [Candidatus Latescibacteria bacterium]|nr:sialidase family protein [Candidatus Latescibacterota bacterium]